MNLKQISLVMTTVLLCTSTIMAAGPRGRRMMRPRHRPSQFPVIVDYQSGAGWGTGRTVQWMPSGSATYANYPAGWRGPIYATVPPVSPVWNGGIPAPQYPVSVPPGVAPWGGVPTQPYWNGGRHPEERFGGEFLEAPRPLYRGAPDESQIEGSESSAGDASGRTSTEL